MKQLPIIIGTLVLITTSSTLYGQKNQYLQQEPPGMTPKVFAKGLISTQEEYEFGSVFSKDGLEFYYGVSGALSEIRYTKFENGSWSTPTTILSADKYGMNDPFLSPDEKKLYYISKKAVGSDEAKEDYDIWYSSKTKKGWSEPINAGTNINTTGNEYYISFTNNGTMYFASNIVGNQHDIYSSELKNGAFQKPKRLGPEINTEHYEADVFIAPDESYIIFAGNRPQGMGRGDLYVSFKSANGSWTQSKNMGSVINTTGHELCPFVSADGKYFFYTSKEDIYWVDAKIIDQLR